MLFRSPENHMVNENEEVTRDGMRVWIRRWNKIQWDAKGEFDGVLSIGTDLTEHRRVEQALQ